MKIITILIALLVPFYVSAKDYSDTSGDIPKEHHTILGLDVKNTALTTINSKLGLVNEYDLGHTESGMCYKNKTHIVQFSESSNGYSYRIMKYTPKFKFIKKCGILKAKSVKTDSGIKLNLTKENVSKTLNIPKNSIQNELELNYWFKEKEEIAENEYQTADIVSRFTIKFNKNKVTEFSVYGSKTY